MNRAATLALPAVSPTRVEFPFGAFPEANGLSRVLDVTVERSPSFTDITLVSRRTGQRVELAALCRVDQDEVACEARRRLEAP